MRLTKKALLAISISGLSTLVHGESASQDYVPFTLKSSAQAEASGFIEGQSLGGSTRNWYANELKRRGGTFRYQKHGEFQETPRRINWLQGTILNHTSGFTQGTVGISTEVAAYNVIALDRSRKHIANGSNRTLAENNGDAVDQWSKIGLANVKARISNTTLTAGRQGFSSPTVDVIGNRPLPSSFQGISLHSAEFDNLSFDLATFDRVSPRTEQSLSKFRSAYSANSAETDHVRVAGLTYQPLKSLTTSLYATQAEDFWDQYYFGAVHKLGDSSVLGLTTGLNYYKTNDSGSKKLGDIDNDTFSLSLGLQHLGHTLSFAYQQVSGNEYFDYLHETNGIYLANSLLSDFNGPNEKSFQVSYVMDMAQYGIPGLKFNIYQARGWGIDGTHYKGTAYDVRNQDGEHHYEYGIGTSYAVQSGPLKSTAIRATYTTHRASEFQADGSINEFRLVTTIPFNIL
ncbi:OprD family porin [Pseudomonas sp. R5(2019)]|uniref:OprD family porin n=1 Tax=Pseudomonas sp. R5(2019) TaxID=2697566 RepID=UPI00141269BE|nr:OprD family porin [Pseudomonas sp. R5(2019)]NBA97078.1 outer membrane porin, OprD family [Pseudomonas sp. R5(2019)]